MSTLTREQFVERFNQLLFDMSRADNLDALNAHDQAQRDQLTRLEQERDVLRDIARLEQVQLDNGHTFMMAHADEDAEWRKQATLESAIDHYDCAVANWSISQQEVDKYKAQLAAREARIKALEEVLKETIVGFERCMRSAKIGGEFIRIKLTKAQHVLAEGGA